MQLSLIHKKFQNPADKKKSSLLRVSICVTLINAKFINMNRYNKYLLKNIFQSITIKVYL